MVKKKIFVLRHGETDLNKHKIIQGSGVDSSLNETGRAQAKAFYEHYREEPFEIVLTSKLKRTHETMAPFIEQGLPWEQYADINEMCWGIYEGKAGTPAMHQRYQWMVEQWQAGNYDAALEQGESASALAARIRRFIDHLKHREEEHLLVCSHGRAMRCLMWLMDGTPLHRMEEYKHSNTGLWILDYAPASGFQFERQNDLQHLDALV